MDGVIDRVLLSAESSVRSSDGSCDRVTTLSIA
jgi:hypothetical protein